MKGKRLINFMLTLLFVVNLMNAQNSRDYIKQQITLWGECKNVAITETNGDLALHGENGWVGSGLPPGLADELNKLNNESELIDDVQLTENGRWIILYGDNGFRWSDIPYSLERKIKVFNSEGDIVFSVTFNDNNDWIIISKERYAASSVELQNWLQEGANEFGMLWAACLTNEALVACYQGGYKFLGNIPYSLKEALTATKMNVYRIKIAGEAWFFSDFYGNYQGKM